MVPPRYGTRIVGGAELALRLFAEHLVVAGHQVEVHTTCATSPVSWADELSPGTTTEAGVTVHRYRSAGGRTLDFDAWGAPVLADPAAQLPSVVDEWLVRQGPWCPEVVEAAAASSAEVVVASPYLYWPTVEVVRAVGRRAVVHPAAHDEAPLRLPVFAEVLGAAGGLSFYTSGERRLVHATHRVGHVPHVVVGTGIEARPAAADAAVRVGVDGRPFLLCLGRVEAGKGTTTLVRFFEAYKARRPGPLALVIAGPVHGTPPSHPDVVLAGLVDEDLKWGLLSDAAALVSPSAYESFSLVLLEGFAVGVPGLVNARCAATVEHAGASGAAVPFADYATFEVALDRLLGDVELRTAMGERGRRYVAERFAWPAVTDRYADFLASVAARATA